MRICVVGLGKLGMPLAACLAAAGHNVVGVDIGAGAVAAVNRGESHIAEPDLQSLIGACGRRLRATQRVREGVTASDVTFVIVPTPSEPNGGFSLRYILPAVREIGTTLRGKGGYHLVVIVSTVMPGMTGGQIQQALEESSGRTVGPELGLCYGPEFVALGSVIHDLTHPDFVLIGESDPRAGETLATVWTTLAQNDPPIVRTGLVNAELAKLSVNAFVTMKISFANAVAELCERIPGADVDAVTGAIGMDTRIGRRYLSGGLAFGGPCFPRDNRALMWASEKVGLASHLAKATDRVNNDQNRRLADFVWAHLPAGGVACILGLAYKPYTNVWERSPGVALLESLEARGAAVRIHDPSFAQNGTGTLPGRTPMSESLEAAVIGADVVVVATPWPQFHDLDPTLFEAAHRPVLIDCWRILDPARYAAVAEYIAFGRASEAADSSAATGDASPHLASPAAVAE